MRSSWSEPFLWIHLAGLAALPLCLAVCLLGLSVGDPISPVGLELALVAVVGIAPVLWMQLVRPFYIFSVVALALRSEQLTLQQRQILSLFHTKPVKVLAILSALFLLWVLGRLYDLAPIVSASPFQAEWRVAGLLLAGVGFLGTNLFLQVPMSVLPVLIVSETEFAATEPIAVENIRQAFTIPGWQVNQILPPIVSTDFPNYGERPSPPIELPVNGEK